MDIDKIITKGMRLTRPRSVNLKLRPEVYEWYTNLSKDPEHHCGLSILLGGVLEDFYDFYHSGSSKRGGDR